MTPLEFITQCGDQYNYPVGAILEALGKPLLIHSVDKKWTVVGYYYDNEKRRMVLDIEPKGRQV